MIEVSSAALVIYPLTWLVFKKYIDGTYKSLSLFYCDEGNGYRLCCTDGSIVWDYFLWHPGREGPGIDMAQNQADYNDFLANWKASAFES